MLCALARNEVVLRLRDLELAAIQRQQRLHRALAECLAAGDDAALIGLDRARKNFRRRRREPIHQHRQRTAPVNA